MGPYPNTGAAAPPAPPGGRPAEPGRVWEASCSHAPADEIEDKGLLRVAPFANAKQDALLPRGFYFTRDPTVRQLKQAVLQSKEVRKLPCARTLDCLLWARVPGKARGQSLLEFKQGAEQRLSNYGIVVRGDPHDIWVTWGSLSSTAQERVAVDAVERSVAPRERASAVNPAADRAQRAALDLLNAPSPNPPVRITSPRAGIGSLSGSAAPATRPRPPVLLPQARAGPPGSPPGPLPAPQRRPLVSLPQGPAVPPGSGPSERDAPLDLPGSGQSELPPADALQPHPESRHRPGLSPQHAGPSRRFPGPPAVTPGSAEVMVLFPATVPAAGPRGGPAAQTPEPASGSRTTAGAAGQRQSGETAGGEGQAEEGAGSPRGAAAAGTPPGQEVGARPAAEQLRERDPFAMSPTPPPRPQEGGRGRRRPRAIWTEEETRLLLEGIERHGLGSWEAIYRGARFANRTAVDLKDRWRVLRNQMRPGVKPRRDPLPPDLFARVCRLCHYTHDGRLGDLGEAAGGSGPGGRGTGGGGEEGGQGGVERGDEAGEEDDISSV
eukprot:jgi/Botrbrau1/9808/Bobra.0322s0015.2